MNTKDTKIEKQTEKIVAEIRQKLTNIEGYMVWLITAGQRFHKGQRVEFSKRAVRNGLVPSTRTNVRSTIKSVGPGFSILVKPDDRKQPRSYHHAFFNPISGPKLF